MKTWKEAQSWRSCEESSINEYPEAVQDIESRTNDIKEPTLEKTRKALRELGNPQNSYETFLVGGTNGKGSTVEMTSKMLHFEELDVGTFRSPHLETVRERIQVNSEMISREEFLQLYERINSLDLGLSFFEFTTVMAYLYFDEKDVDFAVVEVGMGGRLDATNAVENSGAAITNVGNDHAKYLGDTREEIAEEKAGIIPEDGFVVDGTNCEVIEEKAEFKAAEKLRPVETGYRNGSYTLSGEEIDLPVEGSFQAENLGVALRLAEEIKEAPGDVEAALEDLRCRGRMEKVSEDPLYIQDGAHNLQAVEKSIKHVPDGATVVFGCMEDKPAGDMIGVLEEKAEKFYFTAPNMDRSAAPEKLAEKTETPSKTFDNPLEAVKRARGNEEPVVLTGSLYLIGAVRSEESYEVGTEHST